MQVARCTHYHIPRCRRFCCRPQAAEHKTETQRQTSGDLLFLAAHQSAINTLYTREQQLQPRFWLGYFSARPIDGQKVAYDSIFGGEGHVDAGRPNLSGS